MDEGKSKDDAEGGTTTVDEDKTSETSTDKGSEAVKEDEDKSGKAAKIDEDKSSKATTDGNNSSDAAKTDEDIGCETKKIDEDDKDKCVEAMKTDEDEMVVAGSADKADATVPVTICPTDTTCSSQAPPDSSTAKSKTGKVDILLKSTGGAPIMKKTRWTVDGNKPMSWIVNFLRRYLKCEQQQAIFVYVNQSFAPSLDVAVGVLFETRLPWQEMVKSNKGSIFAITETQFAIQSQCFGADGKLVLHYCMTQAWG